MHRVACSILLAGVGAAAAAAPAHTVPQNVLAAYAGWGYCGEAVSRAIDDGANVIIWFASNLNAGDDGQPVVQTGLNVTCAAEVAWRARLKGQDVLHLLSIGGWDAPHPAPVANGRQWFGVWQKWNEDAAAAVPARLGWGGFAGFDWDLEGNDKVSSPWNTFSHSTLEIMKDMSAAAKAAGYVVSMAPPQSYLDPSTGAFSRSLLHPPVDPWYPDFKYQGRNVYAYLLADGGADSFEFISIQLYESYSGAGYHFAHGDGAQYLKDLSVRYAQGWDVDFAADPAYAALGTQRVAVPPSKLVFGLANGWATPASNTTKSLFIWPSTVRAAFDACAPAARPRGAMYWDIPDEGRQVAGETIVLAANLSWISH